MKIKMKTNGDKTITHSNIKAKLGLTDKQNHNVFYLEGGTFIVPDNELEDFTSTMHSIESACRRSIKNKLHKNDFLDSNFLMNFEICSDRMKQGKSSYLSFQYHFKQKDNLNKSIIELKKDHNEFFIDLLNDMVTELHKFRITPYKKKVILP
jgi:hypothetical protein